MSGSAIQGLSPRDVGADRRSTSSAITSLDWVSYPILRFKDAPVGHPDHRHPGEYVTVVPGARHRRDQGQHRSVQPGLALTGSGEPPTAAVGSAVANAIFDATGVPRSAVPADPGERPRRVQGGRDRVVRSSASHGGKGLATGPSLFRHRESWQARATMKRVLLARRFAVTTAAAIIDLLRASCPAAAVGRARRRHRRCTSCTR